MKNVLSCFLMCMLSAGLWGPVSGAASPPAVFVANKNTSSTPAVNDVRHHTHKDYTRVVLDLTGKATVKERTNPRTHKATISLANTTLSARAQQQIGKKQFPKGIAISQGTSGAVSIILDLPTLRTYRLLRLGGPDRVVVDLFYAKPPSPGAAKSQPVSSPKTKNAPKPVQEIPKDVLVVIDPGHGGKDPGAIGQKGLREKIITLQVSKRLRDLIQKRLKLPVRLTRSKDTFLDLEDRVAFANKEKAGLFISVHVNSHAKESIRGIEIYHFGKASDPRALEVAARENGMKLESDAPPWQFIIADKLNDRKIEQSRHFAWTTRGTLITTLQKGYTIKDHGIKTAPFYVLRFTTMPSILVEMGFVSNRMEEQRLQNATFQQKLAEGIYQGIQSYLKTLSSRSS